MLVTGIILLPAINATSPASHDLVVLREVINAAANTIQDPNNPNRGFGFNFFSGQQMGTADLVNNITSTILQSKFQLDTNKTAWLLPPDATNSSVPVNTTLLPNDPLPSPPPNPLTPTLPLTSSLALPSVLPTSTPSLTTDLSPEYIDYVSSIPNLSTSLTTLGRAFHREMNTPVNEAISSLQRSITTMQTTMLESDLINSQAIIRAIRASNSLESARQAWSSFLNLPGSVGGGEDADADGAATPPSMSKRDALNLPPPADGRFYTHQELWGRSAPRPRTWMQGKVRPDDAVVQAEEQRAKSAKDAKVGRPFVV